jgi:putative SOS response-associated peptidase YedK
MTLTRLDVESLAEELDAVIDDGDRALYRPRYNVAPTDVHFVLTGAERRQLRPAVWGLTSPERPAPVINARAETVQERALFRQALAQGRCVVPADGFFEWIGPAKARRPIWFHSPSGGLLLMAGLVAPGRDGEAAFVVLTTDANTVVRQAHGRMPVILDQEGARKWLAGPRLELLAPAADAVLVGTPVSSRVNDVTHDDPECLGPADQPPQLSLFK